LSQSGYGSDESQQYGNYHEIAALAAIQQPELIVFVGDHRQTPGSLSKERAAVANRSLESLWRFALCPAHQVALLWPDASQNHDSHKPGQRDSWVFQFVWTVC